MPRKGGIPLDELLAAYDAGDHQLAIRKPSVAAKPTTKRSELDSKNSQPSVDASASDDLQVRSGGMA